MKKLVGLSLRSALCVTLAGVIAENANAQETAKSAVRIIAEAEDFTIRTPGWEIVPYRENYFASTFAITFLSRMACLGAPEQLPDGQTTIAEQVINVPIADTYEVLGRYEQPFQYSCEFTVEIEQKGKVVGKLLFGRLQDEKYWPFDKGKTAAMKRFWWGATDNIVWQNPGKVKLAEGTATLRLLAGAQKDGKKPRVTAARRHVDVIVLTNDRAGMEKQHKTGYLPFDGWLTQDGDLYARLTNRGDKPIVPTLAPYSSGQHSPYYIHQRDWSSIHVLAKGYVSAQNFINTGPRAEAVLTKNMGAKFSLDDFLPPPDQRKKNEKPIFPAETQIQPGKTSAWVPIGQMIDALNDSGWNVKTDVPYDIEFGLPDNKGGIRAVKRTRVDGATSFEMPGNIAPNNDLTKILKQRWWLPKIRTIHEALTWLTGEVKKFPQVGSVPKRLLVFNIGGFGGTPSSAAGQELMAALGDNTLGAPWKGKKRGLVAHWRDVRPEFFEKQNLSDLRVISYGDEVHLPAFKLSDDDFAAWLRAKKVQYPGKATWEKSRDNPLFYYSQLAGTESGAKSFIAATAHYLSQGTLAGVNYSPHSNYLVSDIHYVLPFKLKALSMAWSEDYVWQVPEFSIQVIGYLTSAFRCGVKYHNQPIMMYVMPHSPGNTPGDFRRSFYTTIAHGSTLINYFCASPLATGGTENYVATTDLPMWRQVHDCTHEAGLFEDYVMDAKVRPAHVGLLLSNVEDIWSGVANNTLALHNNERKALYFALRHAQIPVDMITEDDVIDGLAKDVDVLYVTQRWMHSKCVAALQKWVQNGGTLVALCGGGFLDEFNQPSRTAPALYGVDAQSPEADPVLINRYLLEANKPFLTKQDLPLYEPFDTVTWTKSGGEQSIADVPVIAWKQKLRPKDATVLGTFKDGSPAVTMKKQGKGAAYLFGFLPGQAYLKSGLPIMPVDRGSHDNAAAHFLPTAMDVALRTRLTDDFLPESFARPVVCDNNFVETTCIDTPASKGIAPRLAVPLINYTPQAIENLTVRIADVAKVKRVSSVKQGQLKPTFDGNTLTVTLPLDVADMILIDL